MVPRLLVIPIVVGLVVGAGVGFAASPMVEAPVLEAEARAALAERRAYWLTQGFTAANVRDEVRVAEGEPVTVELPARSCTVVLRASLGREARRTYDRHAGELGESRQCSVEAHEHRVYVRSRSSWRTGVLGFLDHAERAELVVVLSAPFSEAINPLSFWEGRDSDGGAFEAARAAYVDATLADLAAASSRVLVPPARVPDVYAAALVPATALARQTLHQARGLYPNVHSVPRGFALPAAPGALREGVELEAGEPAGGARAEGGYALVPRYRSRARALAVVDVTALAADCVDVVLMPQHNHAERVRVTGLRSGTGVNATLHARADRTLRDRVCTADGPVVYMTSADALSPVGLLVLAAEGAPAEPVATPDAGVAERTACLAAPADPGCEVVLRAMIQGVGQPIAPRAALPATQARCNESDPSSCVLYAQNLYALGDQESAQAAYLLLEQACAAGDAHALELRAELRR